MKQLKYLLLLIPSLFVSCEGYKHIEGTVLDNQTRKPLERVLIMYGIDYYNDYNPIYVLTDSAGRFECSMRTICLIPAFLSSITGPRFPILAIKTGYKDFRKNYNGFREKPVTILLKKEEEK